MKPPISKAKMTAITKGAIKAVKFYKHVVQSVEKFLQKVSNFGHQLSNTLLVDIMTLNFFLDFSVDLNTKSLDYM
jgi:hypothetical protein